jgi:hypothetical protein
MTGTFLSNKCLQCGRRSQITREQLHDPCVYCGFNEYQPTFELVEGLRVRLIRPQSWIAISRYKKAKAFDSQAAIVPLGATGKVYRAKLSPAGNWAWAIAFDEYPSAVNWHCITGQGYYAWMEPCSSQERTP